MFSSNDELYKALKVISEEFRNNGKTDVAQRIDDAMYSGCTSGEVLGDILVTLTDLSKIGTFTGSKYDGVINAMISDINKAL